ncbi:MAG: HupE/UreJ family protein [Catalinimonas sp.]
MSEFGVFLELGLRHILDPKGYDHMLFLVALCAIYTLREGRTLLWLVTAFTVGHSVALALATFRVVEVSAPLIETLIPATILITALLNVYRRPANAGRAWGRYTLAGAFGIIHGLGFSNYLRALLPPDTSVVGRLLAFNLGVEIGQVLFVLAFVLLATVIIRRWRVPAREWNLFISGAVAGAAVVLIVG